jgi:thiol-disulfide isomerase/thioredoxin
MQQVVKQTKAVRRVERSRRRAEALRREERRRRLTIWISAVALVAVAAVGAVAFVGAGDATVGDRDAAAAVVQRDPSDPGDVTTSGVPRTEPLAVGAAIPDFSAPDVFGGTVRWEDYAGAPAVLAVWAPWCPHCQVELPVLDRVMKEFPAVPLVTVVTSIGDSPGPTPDGYMNDHSLRFPAAVDDADGTLARVFGIRAFPTLYFVGSDGAVVRFAEGEVEAQTLRDLVGSLT